MNNRDKIQALWLNLELIMNALEELGEGVQTASSRPRVSGTTAAVVWDTSQQRWVLQSPW